MKKAQATPEHMGARAVCKFGRERLAQFEPEVVPESERTGRRFETGVVD